MIWHLSATTFYSFGFQFLGDSCLGFGEAFIQYHSGFVLNIRTQTLWNIYLTAHSFLLIASNGWSSTLIMGTCDLRYIVAQCAFTFSRKGIKSTNDGLLAYTTSAYFDSLTVVCIITWKTTCRYERSANYLLHAILTITL